MCKRLTPKERRRRILNAAVELAIQSHYQTISRKEIAKAARVSQGLINHYFGNMTGLRNAIFDHARTAGTIEILAQMQPREIPANLKNRVAAYVSGS